MFSGSGYFANILVLSILNGPTEGLMLIYLSHFFTALVEILTNNIVLLLMVAFVVIPTVYCNLSLKKIIFLVTALPICCATGRSASVLSPSDLMKNYPHLVVVGNGLTFRFLVESIFGLTYVMNSMCLLCLPFVVANALTAKLNDGITRKET
ncbi:hypothetical protein H5410_010986 [Solanum commersonii]|uniref:Uncharacterized protein n=1 Tax=Solanum commersonii TaxID=4109 RepID=A0A9J6AM95_SOLCO|nr:hypothetical protein H5410_010986 [Solanum commersonii]